MLTLLRKVYRNDLLGGLSMLLLSYIAFIFPPLAQNSIGALILCGLFFVGCILIANFVTEKVGGFSMLPLRHKRKFVIISLIIGTILQVSIGDLGSIWYYPFWDFQTYVVLGYLLGGWAFYIMFLIICYEAVKLLLDKYIPGSRQVTRYYNYERYLYKIFFGLGVTFVAIFVVVAVHNTHYLTQYSFVLNVQKAPFVSWPYLLMLFTGMYMIAEYVSYKRHRTSLTKDTLHGYFNPLLAVIVMGLSVAILSEAQNLSTGYWRYANYPLGDFVRLPISLTWGWAFHVAIVIVMWRAFGDKNAAILFANSKKVRKSKRHADVTARRYPKPRLATIKMIKQ